MRCDVLVIGAGPGGSALANRLALDGFEVRLADKKTFPREKPCGEFLSPQCEPYLEALGIDAPLAALGPLLVRGMRLHGYGAEVLGRFRRLSGQPASASHGIGIRRERFDMLLCDAAEAAGAEWMPRHEFVSLLRNDDGRVTGAVLRAADGHEVRCEARFVVGADGVHSRVARALGVQRQTKWLDRFALVTHFAGVAPMATAEVHLFPDGFFAATTIDGGEFSVNLILPRSALRTREAADWDGFVAQHVAKHPALAARLVGARRTSAWRGIGPLAYSTTRQTMPGIALVGDACGYVDPLTGEGIYFALFGARALGDAITESLHEPAREPSLMRAYVAERRREIVPRARASALLQRALRHPWLVRHFLAYAAKHPGLADLVVTLTGDSIHPRDLLRPAFWRAFRAASA